MRFAAIATEVGTGHEIWLTRGALALAMRASYALPGIFPPVHLGGRWLVDGALVNPVPVSAARALRRARRHRGQSRCRSLRPRRHHRQPRRRPRATSEAPPAKPRNGFPGLRGMFGAERALKRQILAGAARPSFSTVMIEAFNIMQDRLTRMRLAGDPPDVHITPHIGHIGWLDFHRAAEAIASARPPPKRRWSRSLKPSRRCAESAPRIAALMPRSARRPRRSAMSATAVITGFGTQEPRGMARWFAG